MKLALIGGGYWGKNLIREFNNCGVLETICDLNLEELKKYNKLYPEIKTTTQWNTDVLKNKDITSVCISLPADLHYLFAKNALLADKDVYIEKPITLDINQAKELVELAKDKNKILMVGHLLHYHPCIQKIKTLIKNDTIGIIKSITCNRLNLGKVRKEENVLWSFAPHDISVVLSLCGNKLPNSYECFGIDILKKKIHDITNSILKFNDDKIHVNINTSWINPTKEQKMTIIGEKGIIIFDDTKDNDEKLMLHLDHIKINDVQDYILNKDNKEYIKCDFDNSPLLNECKHFTECCLTRKNPITDGEEGLRVLTVLDNLQKKLLPPVDNKDYFIHPTAVVDKGAIIGKGTKIWHYSHICKDAIIGENCNIGQNVFIAGGAKIGNNCKVQNNVSIYAGIEAEDYVFFGPSCVLTNDINPRCMHSKNGKYIKTKLETGVSLGANSTIVCGTNLGKHCLIGSGAVICKDVPNYSIMVGNPGRKIGIIDEKGNRTLD